MSVLHQGEFVDFPSEDILIGDLVRVRKDEAIPCDMVLLQSADERGRCYIETKNLDG